MELINSLPFSGTSLQMLNSTQQTKEPGGAHIKACIAEKEEKK